jgi:hypothetical protein
MTKEEIKLVRDERKTTKEHYEARLRGSLNIIELQAARLDEMSQQINELNRIIKEKDDQIVHLQTGMTGEEKEYYGGI